MEKIGSFEAKDRWSEVVDRAGHSEGSGITRCGKLAAKMVSARSKARLKEDVDDTRKRAKLPPGVDDANLNREGRV